MNEEIKLLLRTLDTFCSDLEVEGTKVTTLCLNNKEGQLLNKYIKELQHQFEEKEEQMNIMSEAFKNASSEAFDELEHQKQDYTEINILEMKLEIKRRVIDELYNYLNNFDTKSLEEQGLGVEVKEFIVKPLEILERGKDENN